MQTFSSPLTAKINNFNCHRSNPKSKRKILHLIIKIQDKQEQIQLIKSKFEKVLENWDQKGIIVPEMRSNKRRKPNNRQKLGAAAARFYTRTAFTYCFQSYTESKVSKNNLTYLILI